ncbi:pilus assembly protein PilM [[Eubacterium] hominis]|uniref:pilus assembly protein PilM n=1 Tax=[Eubacterium] hominis TaxID=2764325 RepID=UPI003A4DF8F4
MKKEYVIFISNHNVQVIKGSCDRNDMIKVDDYKQYELTEGCMINGIITDDQPIKEILDTIKGNGVNSCRLVIDSGQIIVKNMNIPILKGKEIIKIVQDELASVEQGNEEMIYDYSVLRKNYEDQPGGEILCCSLEKKLLTSYIDLFSSAGIILTTVDISVNALMKLTQELPDLEHQTYIVSILDGNNVSSYLFEDNHYTFSNRSRLFSERGTNAFITEMSSNISQLIQFNKSKRSLYTIETAYFCGLEDEEEPIIFDNIRRSLNINAETFPDSKVVYLTDKTLEYDFRLHDAVYPIGSLIRK